MNNDSQEKSDKEMWDQAIADAQYKMTRIEKRLRALQAAQRTYKLHREQLEMAA